MRKLPNSELVVSELCLGTMNFGDQLSKAASFELLDLATNEYGINFLVTLDVLLELILFLFIYYNFFFNDNDDDDGIGFS